MLIRIMAVLGAFLVAAPVYAKESGKRDRSPEEQAVRKACKRAAKKQLPNATQDERRQFARACRKRGRSGTRADR